MPRPLPSLLRRRLLAVASAALFALLAFGAVPVGAIAPHHSATFGALSGTITGPTTLGTAGRGTYHVVASGGPAIAPNGTQVGTITFAASIVGLNTTTGSVAPPQGVLENGTTNLSLVAPNLTQSMTLYVDLTSSYQGHNVSTNLTYSITVVQPLQLGASLKVVGPTGVKAFSLTVDLDGASVGSIAVPTLTAGQNFPLSFSYVGTSLSPGWHTFTLSLAQEHGLVVFSNGEELLSVSFYVAGPPPDYPLWFAAGALGFGAVVFIWFTLVGARRRPKGKN
ncbi:MAG: hypothetical protein L3K08_04125 [Thermoplasmata archaeon]|nr:hypothetical protein [Thermoplasmata archaeon]